MVLGVPETPRKNINLSGNLTCFKHIFLLPIVLSIELPIVLPIELPIVLPIGPYCIAYCIAYWLKCFLHVVLLTLSPVMSQPEGVISGEPWVHGSWAGPFWFGLGGRGPGRTLLVWLGGPGSWAGPAYTLNKLDSDKDVNIIRLIHLTVIRMLI